MCRPSALFVFLLLAILLWLPDQFGSVTASSSVTGPTTLLKTFILGRHGARAPLSPKYEFYGSPACCDAANFSSIWPLGAGSLTTVGSQEWTANGQRMRSQYPASVLPAVFDKSQVYVMAAPGCQRCLESALYGSAGIFGLSYTQAGNMIPVDKTNFQLAQLEQPCALRDTLFTDFLDQPSTQQFINNQVVPVGTQTASHMPAAAGKSGDAILDIAAFGADTLVCNAVQGISAGPWATTDYVRSAWQKTVNDFFFYMTYGPAELPVLDVGALLQMVSLWFYPAAARPDLPYAFPSAMNMSQTTFVLGVAHDETIAAVLNAMQLFGPIFQFSQPPFASYLAFELHADVAGSLYVQVVYTYQQLFQVSLSQDVLLQPLCGNATMCPAAIFATAFQAVFLNTRGTFESWCQTLVPPYPVQHSGTEGRPFSTALSGLLCTLLLIVVGSL